MVEGPLSAQRSCRALELYALRFAASSKRYSQKHTAILTLQGNFCVLVEKYWHLCCRDLSGIPPGSRVALASQRFPRDLLETSQGPRIDLLRVPQLISGSARYLFQIMPDDARWCPMIPDDPRGLKWSHMIPVILHGSRWRPIPTLPQRWSYRWSRIIPDDPGWSQMISDDVRCL